MPIISSMLWRRVNAPGHDACRLEQGIDRWKLEGAAIFRHEDGPANISYSVQCDVEWQTPSGRIRGFVGQRSVHYTVVRSGGLWTLNDAPVPGLRHLLDLDLGFTPATNLQQLRRVSIAANETVHLPVAWLDVDAGTLSELPQIYERRGEAAFWYQAPSFGYEGLLELAPNGFIRSYPGLWEAEVST
jgi:uncharacterized protein